MLKTKKIDRSYIFTTKELRDILGLKGTLYLVQLWKGRSEKEKEKGVSADKDQWIFHTQDKETEAPD